MTRFVRSASVVIVVALAAACASAWPQQRLEIAPGTVSGDSALEAGFLWISVDGKRAPTEFPVNSGVRLLYGTLDLRNAAAARAGTGGTYSLRFTLQPVGDTARATSDNGRFVIRADSLLLTPTGQVSPVVYRYAWRPNGDLALTDGANHLWVYARR